jgi:formylglycine-generating enzyme required for sulfatase activity
LIQECLHVRFGSLRKNQQSSRASGQAASCCHHLPLRAFSFHAVTLDRDGRETERRRGRALQFSERLGKRAILHMVQIPGASFTMGAAASEAHSSHFERPQREVNVPPFYLGKTPVTVDQWRAVMGASPPAMQELNNRFKVSGRQPVVSVSCGEAEAFCAQLSRTTRRAYRLPTEAEWEYACRAGTASPFAFGENITQEVVNYDGDFLRLLGQDCATTPVGSRGVANAFGLFDMHGNVWEWCQDFWHASYEGGPTDGSAWRRDADTGTRVLRGGSWSAPARLCRSAVRRFGGHPAVRSREIGFRVAMADMG